MGMTISGSEKVIVLDKALPAMRFRDFPELKLLASRWTSTGVENYYLRFNSPLEKEELKAKIAAILGVSEQQVAVYETPFMGLFAPM